MNDNILIIGDGREARTAKEIAEAAWRAVNRGERIPTITLCKREDTSEKMRCEEEDTSGKTGWEKEDTSGKTGWEKEDSSGTSEKGEKRREVQKKTQQESQDRKAIWQREWEALAVRYSFAVVAVAKPESRLELMAKLEACGYTMVTLIHPESAVSPSASLGKGCIIHPMASIGAGATLGAGVWVRSGAIVEEDCLIGDACLLESGAVVKAGSIVPPGTVVKSGEVFCEEAETIFWKLAKGEGWYISEKIVTGECLTGKESKAFEEYCFEAGM